MLFVSAFFNSIYALWNQIIYAVSNMRIPFDILDILIIAYLIYKAIGFLRETRAGQLVKGLIILFGMYLIANWFDLASLKWLLSKVVNSAIIAAAVIFQPELRRLLEKVGRANFSRGQLLDDEAAFFSEGIDKITKAAGMMQESKTGALIVFERKTQLGEIVNTGTVIDAEISVSMVNNIFYPKSPLHDGALIVRDGRLYAAACILPLTQREDISAQLGTRHRAAIGMTENSDAVVLVVSEETGTISIVSNGEITRNYNAVSANERLKNLLIDTKSAKDEKPIISFFKKINPFKKENTQGKEVAVNAKSSEKDNQ